MNIRTTLPLFAAILAVLIAGPAGAAVQVDASLAQPYMLAADGQKAYLRISLSGEGPARLVKRTPVNLAIVLDKSGSMQGQKIEDAKVAAIKAVSMLEPGDIVSVVAYDDGVRVIVPATKVGDGTAIRHGIQSIDAGGSTALFAGVSHGAAELRKFYDRNNVNRIVLLSDGLANVGPSSPGDLADLGTSLGREGIAVTTIGLGLEYNEDLMTQLAQKSDGNHMFAEEPGDLDEIFARELGSVTNVVAQDVEIIINCANGARPIRVFGREAEIIGDRVVTSMNQIYGEGDRYVLLEVALPGGQAATGESLNVAEVECRYNDVLAQREAVTRAPVAVAFTDSQAVVDKHTDKLIMASVIEQVGVIENERALRLRDEGKIEAAKDVLEKNAAMLEDGAKKYDAPALTEQSEQQLRAYDNIENDEDWKRQRKVMREEQYQIVNQQQVNN